MINEMIVSLINSAQPDQVNNAIWRYFVSEKKFEMYKVPTLGAYPAFIEFDSQGNVWFSEIFGKKLGVLYPH